jgi:hypothetical protein
MIVLTLFGAVFVIAVLYVILKRVQNPPPQEVEDQPDNW